MRSLVLWLPVGAWMALLFVLSAQPTPPGPKLVWDKLAHVVAYAVLSLATLRAAHGGRRPLALRPTLAALAVAVGYGGLDELHQAFVPGRFASWLDWAADATGAVSAVPLFALLSRGARGAAAEGAGS